MLILIGPALNTNSLVHISPVLVSAKGMIRNSEEDDNKDYDEDYDEKQ